MISKKYSGDYRLENREETGKKPKTVPVYTGQYFVYPEGTDLKKLRVRHAAAAAIAWAALISALCLNTFAAHRIYVSGPLAVSFLPLLYLSFGVYSLAAAEPPYTREQRDKTYERIVKSSFMVFVLSLAALIGDVIVTASSPELLYIPQDIIFCGLTAVECACAASVFFRRRELNTVKK